MVEQGLRPFDGTFPFPFPISNDNDDDGGA